MTTNAGATMFRTITRSLAVAIATIQLVGCSTTSAPVNTRYAPGTQAPMLRDQVPSGPARADQSESATVNTELAAAYLQSGRTEVAKEVIARALASDPNSPLALAVQGLIYGETRDYARGDESFRRALQISPGDPDLNHNYALYLCRTNRTAQSIAYFEKAIKTPGYPRALISETSLGNCLLKIGRLDEAEANFKHVLAAERSNPPALLGQAEAALRRGDTGATQAFLTRYNRSNPPSPQSLWLMLSLERTLGNKTEAEGVAADLSRLFPGSDQAQRLGDDH